MQKTMVLSVVLFVAVLGRADDLEKVFADALKAGEPLTAEKAFKELAKANPAPIRYFEAAEVAHLMGNETLRRDRLAYFLREEKGWNEKTEQAAWYLCLTGGSAEHFERLAKNVPADLPLFWTGCRMMDRAVEAKRGQELVRLADVILPLYAENDRRLAVYSRLLRLLRDNVPNIDPAHVRELIMKYPVSNLGPEGGWTPSWLLAQLGHHFSPEFVLQWCQKAGAVLGDDAFGLTGRFDSNNKEVCAKLAPQFKAIEPLMFKPGMERRSEHYLWCVTRVGDYLFAKGEEPQRAAWFYGALTKFFAIAKDYNRNGIRQRVREIVERGYLRNDQVDYLKRLRTEYPQYLDDDTLIGWSGLDNIADKSKNVQQIKEICKKYPERAAYTRWRYREAFAKYDVPSEVFAIVEEFFYDNLANVNGSWEVLDVLEHSKASDADRINFLKQLYGKVGSCGFFNWLKRDYNGIKNRNKWLAAPEAKAFVDTINDKTPPGDKLLALTIELRRQRRVQDNKAPDRAHEIVKEIFAQYSGDFPQDGRPRQNRLVNQALEYYTQELARHNRRSAETAAELLLKKFGKQKKAPWWRLGDLINSLGDQPELAFRCAQTRALVTGDQYDFRRVLLPDVCEKLPEGVNLEKMDMGTMGDFIWANWWHPARGTKLGARFKPALAAELFVTYFNCFDPKTMEEGRINDFLSQLNGLNPSAEQLAKFPFDKVADALWNGNVDYRRNARRYFMGLAARVGKQHGYLKRELEAIAKLPPPGRVQWYCELLASEMVTPFKGENSPDIFGSLTKSKLLTTLKETPDKWAPLVLFNHEHEWFQRRRRYWDDISKAKDQEAIDTCNQLDQEIRRLLLAGAQGYWGPWGDRGWLFHWAFLSAVSKTNQAAAVKYAVPYGRVLNHVNWDAANALNKAKQTGCLQALYLVVTSLPEDNMNGDVRSLANRLRSEIASKLPGIYPVSEKDPAFPLYVAADQLANKNHEAALKLLLANIPVFEREAVSLPGDFTAWAVDQLRLQRGAKDELVVKARQIATQIIANESKVTAELAAAMLLVRAESYRDQQNFEAAKLEYQSIRDNPTYHKTSYGRKAMFRAVDLQIESGAGSQAEPTLEYWLSQPDPEIQAEAHYFLARIAFDRKDFDECIKQLREVFAINLTHTEARFLQGKWKLATNSEVDETDVWIGKLADRTAIRPGQQLSITVQDRNLSVAGAGSSIPVIVRTDRGKDEEPIYLYPSARDPNLFKGMIDVRLAAPVASNSVLEVRGDDIASYVIDPAFLKARGLPLGETKKLRVVDDARLAIGAGAPRTEESDSAAQIESMVSEEGDSGSKALVQALRPGNALYVAVSDKDRSLGGQDDQVLVSVETSSGDRIGKVALKEVSPYAGVFRGVIATALPPPRAFASDTAAGFNPGDVINSTREGEWRSLADKQPVKWFAVDTMGSHLVSNVTIRMAAPEEITAVSLKGVLAGESIRVGSLPATDPATRVGLKFQTSDRGGFRGEQDIREFMTKAGAPKETSVTNFTYRPQWDNRSNVARFSGAFLQPAGYDYLRFVLQPLSNSSDALKDATFALAIDGSTVFTGRGQQLQNATFIADVTPGAHFLEVFAIARSQKQDAFQLLWAPLSEEPRDIPLDWFDAKAHTEVWDYLADKAVIERTKDGFSATFPKPIRLRTIRWEFTGRKSPDVVIKTLTAIDSKGKAFLPVNSDFSDAQSNDTLEVAPGDRIIVKYEDEVTAAGSKKVLEKTMPSCFTDGQISLNFEEIAETSHRSTYFEAYRFIPGDTLTVIVRDSDLDVSDQADTVEATVETELGGKQTLTLLEGQSGDNGQEGVHSGYFYGLLKTIPESQALPTNANKKASSKLTLRMRDSDVIQIGYVDRENTKPGVPCVRKANVHATAVTTPQLTLFHTRKTKVEDNSPDAKAKLALIRKRVGNEKVEKLYRDVIFAVPMTKAASAATNDIPMNIAAPILARVNDPSRARHSASFLTLEAVTERELKRAEAEGDEPQVAVTKMGLGANFGPVKLKAGAETAREARRAGSFDGYIRLAIGTENIATTGRNDKDILSVNGNDKVRLTVKDGDEVVAERTLTFVSNGALALMDSSWSAERNAVHAGERFFVRVDDADRDETDESDRIMVNVKSLVSGWQRQMVLSESVPHSGVFSGMVRPVLFAPGEEIPAAVTGGVATVDQLVAEDRFAASFGDRLVFSYRDEKVLPGSDPRTLCVTGIVHRGSDGNVRLFSKRFRDSDQAVLVQFRLAECLFEQAKEFRKLKQQEKSTEAIAKGRFILEEALKNYPNSAHVMQGEFLLANLFQELAAEQHEAKNEEGARKLYTDALARFSSLLAAWPDGAYAARAQYHKALCLEMLADYRHAAEEYVKMTYLYPESELVGDATIRLATHYYQREHRYEVSARIYENFQKRFPQHDKAPRALFMCGSCYIKQAETIQKKANDAEMAKTGKPVKGVTHAAREMYRNAAQVFARIGEVYRTTTTPELRAQALYWEGDVELKANDSKAAYRSLKRCVLEYPETEWARRARGLLLQEADAFTGMEEQ